MNLIEWVEERNKGKLLSGVMPVKSMLNSEYKGMNTYAFKYSIPNANYWGGNPGGENVCVIFLDEPYMENVGMTLTTLSPENVNNQFEEDTTRSFLKFDDVNLMKWIDTYIIKYGLPLI